MCGEVRMVIEMDQEMASGCANWCIEGQGAKIHMQITATVVQQCSLCFLKRLKLGSTFYNSKNNLYDLYTHTNILEDKGEN